MAQSALGWYRPSVIVSIIFTIRGKTVLYEVPETLDGYLAVYLFNYFQCSSEHLA